MGMGIDQWEWEGMGILIVFPHTSTANVCRDTNELRELMLHFFYLILCASLICHKQ